MKLNGHLIPAALGQVAFAGYWILLSSSIIGSGQIATPIIISRLAGTVFMVLLFAAFRKPVPHRRMSNGRSIVKYAVALGAIAGIMDGIGNGLYATVVTLGQLAVAGIIISFSPLLTILLARIFYRERLSKLQLAGMVIAVAGAIALIIG